MAKSVAPKSKRRQKKFSVPQKAGSKPRELPAKGKTKLGQVLITALQEAVLHHKSTAKPKSARKRTRKLPGKRALKAAGLPQPGALAVNSKAYKALQDIWYAKLAASGFDDLEWTKGEPGNSQNSDYLKGSAARGRTWAPERAQFYRLLQNYLTHYQFANMQDRYVLHALNDGITYRAILAACKKRYKLKRSLYWFYYYVQDLVAKMVAWNSTHKEGLLNPANSDRWADDALLSDLRGTAGVLEAPNGLKLDQGWWLENMADWWSKNGSH